MPLQPGSPAEDADIWMRILTHPEYLKKDGTVHNSAFSGRRAIAPPASDAPWSLEMSGRLLSLIQDIQGESEAFCVAPMMFVGLIYQSVENLRSNGSGCTTDVVYTPKPTDNAHADLVAYADNIDNRNALRDWLQDFIQCVPVTKCAMLEALRI
jgi:hypothetical protein